MSTATRTDVHSPTHLRTEDYQFLGTLDWRGGPADARAREALIQRVISQARRKWAAVHPSGQCDHCGARLRYAALMLHTPSNTVIEIGETCLENRFPLATKAFQQMRRAAASGSKKQRQLAEFAARYPDLAFLTTEDALPPALASNNFVVDVGRDLRERGSLSEAQIRGLRNVLARAAADKAIVQSRLRGTERQVLWAEKIREEKLLIVDRYIQFAAGHADDDRLPVVMTVKYNLRHFQELRNKLADEISAVFWIDHRNDNAVALLRAAG